MVKEAKILAVFKIVVATVYSLLAVNAVKTIKLLDTIYLLYEADM